MKILFNFKIDKLGNNEELIFMGNKFLRESP